MYERFCRFSGVEFGVAPAELWPQLRRDLLEFEAHLACRQSDVGLVPDYPFNPKVKPGTKVFQRPTPLPPDQREWVRKEMLKMESMGVLERVATCDSACGVVLVEQG